jgi:positive regulator of sigma E activity
MMLCRIPLDEAVLLYLLSLLLYLLSALLWHKLKKKDMREAAGKEGEV